MNTRFKSGFTIIEVMLFLAITGLLIAGVLGGTLASLNAQRYRDGVETVRSEIRSQYEKVYSLTNSVDGGVGSGVLANAVDPCSVMEEGGIEASVYRGSSDCLYVGRLIKFEPNGTSGITKMTVLPVVAKVLQPAAYSGVFKPVATPASNPAAVTDATGLQAAVFDRNSNLVVEKEMDWGLAAVRPNSNTLQSVGLFIFRSPMNGAVSSYVVDDLSAEHLRQLQTDISASQSKEIKLCFADLNGGLDPSRRSAVIVHAGATGPGDIETIGEGSGC